MEIITTEHYEVITPLSEGQARDITEDIKTASSMLYILLKRAHDERAWASLGYNTWGEYIDAEFEFSRARSYQLITQARVIDEINEAVGSEVDVFISEREARRIKRILPEITSKIVEAKDDWEIEGADSDDDTADRVRRLIEEAEAQDRMEAEASEDRRANQTPVEVEEEVDRGQHWEKPFDDEPTPASDESKYYTENLSRMLSMFDVMPNPNILSPALAEDAETLAFIKEASDRAIMWLNKLIEQIEE